MRGGAAGMALEIRFSFCGLDSVFFAMRAIAAAMAKKMSVPRVNMLLEVRVPWSDGCLPINMSTAGGGHVNLYIYYAWN